MIPRLLFTALVGSLFIGCASSERDPYAVPTPPQKGKIIGFNYAYSPTGGDAAGEFLLNVVSPFGYMPNDSHIPVYQVRLEDGRVVNIRDPDAPTMMRGTAVMILTDDGGGRSLMPLPSGARPQS